MRPPCHHQIEIGRSDAVGCESPRIVTGGIVPRDWCEKCPVWESLRSRSFFEQTSRLWVSHASSGEYKPKAKSCGGCSAAKSLQFVWPYWSGGSKGDELRYSIRSAMKFFDGNASVAIIGDCPKWYSGLHIPKKRVPANRPNRAFRDMLSKVWFMATKPEINHQFVWMMDDVYFLRPFTLRDLQVPRAERWSPSHINSWQKRKNNTMKRLASVGAPTWDYATHLCHLVEKQKLRSMFDEYDLHNQTLLWEVLYGNLYRGKPQRSRPFLCRLTNRLGYEQIQSRTRNSTVLNHVSSAWNGDMHRFLDRLLPEKCSVER